MAKKITTLFIDQSYLRLMVTDGNQIKSWSEAPLEAGIIENGVVVDEEEFIQRVHQILGTQETKSGKIHVGISGLRCLTRPITLPSLPDNILDEAVRREAERALPVPLEQLYLFWKVIERTDEETRVFVETVPRETADSLLGALTAAGLRPALLDAKPLLISGMVQDEMAIIVDVQGTEFDVVIMVDGVPQPVRTTLLPSASDDWEEKLSVIASEFNRTVTFYNSNNPERTINPEVPVYISGEIAYEEELCAWLSSETGFSLRPLETTLNYPPAFVPSYYMANIGLVMRELASRKSGITTINALPESYLPKSISLTNVLTVPGFVVLVVILAAMFFINQNISSDINTVNGQYEAAAVLLQQKQAQAKALEDNIDSIGENTTRVKAGLNNIQSGFDGLLEQRSAISKDLQTTLLNLPPGVDLYSIAHMTSILTISGNAPTEKSVRDYISDLDSSGRFVDITTTSMARTDDETIDFTILSVLQPQAIGADTLEIALGTLPSSISLTNIDSDEDTLNVFGIAPDGNVVVAYMSSLEASQQFSSVTLTEMSKDVDGNMEFHLTLEGSS